MQNQKGFTLVELIAMIIILGIILTFVIPKVLSLNKNAENVGIKMAIIDLNGREMKCWTEIKLGEGWVDDHKVFESCDYKIEDYSWSTLVEIGGQLTFKETTVTFDRKVSTMNGPATWSINE